MDVPGRMELGHEERVHVPELVLHERPAHLLESHADELVLHVVQELPVGMLPADAGPGRVQRDVVGAEAGLLPGPLLQHLGRERRGLLGHGAALPQELHDGLAGLGEPVGAVLLLGDAEDALPLPALVEVRLDELLPRRRGMRKAPAVPVRRPCGSGRPGPRREPYPWPRSAQARRPARSGRRSFPSAHRPPS